MVGIVVAAHGKMASGMVGAAEAIAGTIPALETVDLSSHEGLDSHRERIREAVGRVNQGQGVLVAADLLGGTPANCCVPLVEDGVLEVVTGVNLPMLLRLVAVRDRILDPQTLAADLADYGKRNIQVVGDRLRAPRKDDPT